MEHISVTTKGKYANLVPDAGYMLRRGRNAQLFSEAMVVNTQKELAQWEAIQVESPAEEPHE